MRTFVHLWFWGVSYSSTVFAQTYQDNKDFKEIYNALSKSTTTEKHLSSKTKEIGGLKCQFKKLTHQYSCILAEEHDSQLIYEQLNSTEIEESPVQNSMSGQTHYSKTVGGFKCSKIQTEHLPAVYKCSWESLFVEKAKSEARINNSPYKRSPAVVPPTSEDKEPKVEVEGPIGY